MWIQEENSLLNHLPADKKKHTEEIAPLDQHLNSTALMRSAD